MSVGGTAVATACAVAPPPTKDFDDDDVSVDRQVIVRLDHHPSFVLTLLPKDSETDDGNQEKERKDGVMEEEMMILNAVSQRFRIPADDLIVSWWSPGEEGHDASVSFAHVRWFRPLCGGKGGFGTLLKGQSKQAGARVTHDFGACRDLSGRRLRHVNDEIKLRKWKEAQRRRDLGEEVDEVAQLRTASGIRNWHLMVPHWSDGAFTSSKGRRAAERALEREVKEWKWQQEGATREKEARKAQEQQAIHDYVQTAMVEQSDEQDAQWKQSIYQTLKRQRKPPASRTPQQEEPGEDVDMAQEPKKEGMREESTTMRPKKRKAPREEEEEEEDKDEDVQKRSATDTVTDGIESPLVTLSGDLVVEEEQEGVFWLQSKSDFATAMVLSRPFHKEEEAVVVVNVYYFEVTIRTAGLAQIGWALPESFAPSSATGDGVGDDEFSFGYDGFRQLRFHAGKEVAFGEGDAAGEWQPHDVIGCSIQNRQIQFSKNGQPLGVAFTLPPPFQQEEQWRPAMSLNEGEIVGLRLTPPFRYPPPPPTTTPAASLEDKKQSIVLSQWLPPTPTTCQEGETPGEETLQDSTKTTTLPMEDEEPRLEPDKKKGTLPSQQEGEGAQKTLDKVHAATVQTHTEAAHDMDETKMEATSIASNKNDDTTKKEKAEEETPFDLDACTALEQVQALGMNRLKQELMQRNVKCGGSLEERAKRLFSLKGLDPSQYPSKVKLKGSKF